MACNECTSTNVSQNMPLVLVWDPTVATLALFIIVLGPFIAVDIENANRPSWDQRPFPPLGTTLFTPVIQELCALVAAAGVRAC